MGIYCNDLIETNCRDTDTKTISMPFMMNNICQCNQPAQGSRGLKLIHRLTAATFALCLSISVSVLAQTPIRPEVAKSLQAAQDALKAGQLESALSLSQQTLAMPGITEVEKPLIQRALAVAALQAKNFPLAVSTLENLIQQMPESTPAAQKRPLIESLLNASQQAQDFNKVVDWARIYLKLEGSNPIVRPVLIQTLSVLKRHNEVVQEVNEKIRLDEAAQVKTPESELHILAISQRQLKDDAGYNGTLKILLQNYPSKAYWAEIISRLARQANFNPRFDLDLYRLLELTGNMVDAVEYVDMANLALKSGLPAEAMRVVEQAYAAGVMGKGSDAANHQKLRQQIQLRWNEDEKAMPALEKSAKDANALASLADVYASKQKWDQSQAHYTKALAMGGLRRENETRLHAGIVLFKLGQKVEAHKMWDSIQGDSTAIELAQLWKVWQQAN